MMKSQTAQTSSMSPGTKVFGRFSLKGKVFPCEIVNHKWKSRSKKWTIKFTENFGKNYGPPPRKLQEECIYPFKLFLTKEEAEAGWKEQNITIKSRSSSKQNANGKVISLGEEIHGKWSPPRTAHGTVKSFGKTKVKILLTEDFTKTLVKGMCVEIYFQNTWKTGREPPENWKENFKWKTCNPDKKGSRSNMKKAVGKSFADYKKDMVLMDEYSPTEIIRIAMEYEKINKYLEDKSLDEYVLALDVKRQAEIQAEKELKEKEIGVLLNYHLFIAEKILIDITKKDFVNFMYLIPYQPNMGVCRAINKTLYGK